MNSRVEDCKSLLCLRDPLTPQWPDSLWQRLMDVGRKCSAQLKKHRPAMSDVRTIDVETFFNVFIVFIFNVF